MWDRIKRKKALAMKKDVKLTVKDFAHRNNVDDWKEVLNEGMQAPK